MFLRSLTLRSLIASTACLSILAGSAVATAAPVSPDQLKRGVEWASSTPGNNPVYNENDPFYLPPAEIPAQPGSVIRTQPLPHKLNILGPEFPGYAQKMLYTSNTESGAPVATSGYVIEPAVKWRGRGPVPTVVFAPGTRGQGDACAPSRSTGGIPTSLDQASQALGLNYESDVYELFALQGMRVVVIDYIGLGTPGVHTYLNRKEQGQAMIDGARAALNIAGVPADSPVAFYGYSQGGGAAASAGELAGTYGSELTVAGTYAGAPPADPLVVMDAVDGSEIAPVLGYSINSFIARDAQHEGVSIAQTFNEVFNDRGKYFLAHTRTSCIGDATLRWSRVHTSTLTVDGRSLGQVVRDSELLTEALQEQRVGVHHPLNAPMRVTNGYHDNLIPHRQAVQMARDFCASGGQVDMVTIPQLPAPAGSAINHGTPMLQDAPAAMQFLKDRFNGRPAVNDCGKL